MESDYGEVMSVGIHEMNLSNHKFSLVVSGQENLVESQAEEVVAGTPLLKKKSKNSIKRNSIIESNTT